MAYQNVGTPRFYVNTMEFLLSNGIVPIVQEVVPVSPYDTWVAGSAHNPLFKTIPTQYETLPHKGFDFSNLANSMTGDNCFVAILGHKIATDDRKFSIYQAEEEDSLHGSFVDIVNAGTGELVTPEHDGFSILTFSYTNSNNTLHIYFWSGTSGHSLIFGTFYDMPHSPDLNLTMTREYGGVKHIETKGGASLSNAFYTRPPLWGNEPAWEIMSGVGTTPAPHQAKSGRRIWDLSFSYLQDSDVFPEVSSLHPYESTNADGTVYSWGVDFSGKLLLDDNTFYNQVIHKTNGGQLPFIFNPVGGGDNPDNNIQNFAICKLDMNKFQFSQVANGVYNVKLKIREVW